MKTLSILIRQAWVAGLLAIALGAGLFAPSTLIVKATAPNPSRSVYVHLFEWKWADIANECETWLGPKGFGALQISPPNDHAKVTSPNRPWWEVYQPVSYQLTSRMGDRTAFANMVSRCRAVGVEVYADVVINHMAAIATNPSVAGNSYAKYNYPAAAYSSADFHWFAPAPNGCQAGISNYQDRFNVQFCELVGLPDLRTETTYVRGKIADYLVDLYSLGVRGYRIDAAKHIPASDISAILANVNSRVEPDPYIVQEVMDFGTEPITKSEYYATGNVNEFTYGTNIASNFRGNIANLQTFGPSWGLAPSDNASVFVDNHDMQRGGGGGGYLTYKDGARYDLANVFMLAWPYGYPQVMSSFAFSSDDQGPPSDANGLPTTPDCGGTWVCEQRHRAIANMVAWRNAASSATTMTNWWSNGGNQIAFGRGDRGFVAINNDPGQTLNQTLQTGMAAGVYCNVIAGDYTAPNTCSGPTITVNAAGQATFSVVPMSAAAIHAGAMMSGGGGPTATFTRTPTPTATPTSFAGQVVRQVNAGGAATGGWLSDQYFDQGNQYSDTSSAINTSAGLDPSIAPQAVYQTVHWNANFTYTIPGLTAGQPYTVLLHFAELSFQSAGSRKFNVAINGANVLSAFDIYAAAGFKRAIGKSFNATANGSGQIVIAFTQGGADNPMVSGIEIFSQSGGATSTATVTATRTPTATQTNTAAVTNTATRTPTPTLGASPTATQTNMPVVTNTITRTSTITNTPVITSTPSRTPTSTVTPTLVSGQSAYPSGVAWAIPGTIQAENYDLGGETVAYHDNETANQGGQYRTGEGIDVEVTSDTSGGYNVGWTQANEWLEYTVNVASAGNYTLTERVASNSATGSFRIEFNGVDKTGTITTPNTGGWQTYQTLTQTVSLSAGTQIMRIYFLGNDTNLNYVTLATAGGGGNLALGKAIAENGHNQAYVPTNANDGNTATYWEGAGFTSLLTVDLGSAQTVSSVKIKLNPTWGARNQTIAVLGSTDNVNFTTTLKASTLYNFDPASSNVVTITFTGTSTRYVRLSITTNSGAIAGQVAEFEIYQ